MDMNSEQEHDSDVPWYKHLTRYHWLVFVVCSLGYSRRGLPSQHRAFNENDVESGSRVH